MKEFNIMNDLDWNARAFLMECYNMGNGHLIKYQVETDEDNEQWMVTVNNWLFDKGVKEGEVVLLEADW